MIDRALRPLEERRATLFLLAGALLVVFASNTGARVFADAGIPAVHSVVGPAGFLVGLLGLFGTYPVLVDRSPWATRAAAAVAALPLAGWSVIVVTGVGSTAGVLPGASVVLPGPAFILVILATGLGYLLFGGASLRGGAHSRTVGLALVAPAIPFLVLIVGVAVLGPVEWMEFVIDSGHAAAHLGVGVALRSGGVTTDSPDPSVETTP